MKRLRQDGNGCSGRDNEYKGIRVALGHSGAGRRGGRSFYLSLSRVSPHGAKMTGKQTGKQTGKKRK